MTRPPQWDKLRQVAQTDIASCVGQHIGVILRFPHELTKLPLLKPPLHAEAALLGRLVGYDMAVGIWIEPQEWVEEARDSDDQELCHIMVPWWNISAVVVAALREGITQEASLRALEKLQVLRKPTK